MNPYESLHRSARSAPLSVAVESSRGTLTYQELEARARRVAGGMSALGLEPQQAVGLMLPNVLEFPIALYAAFVRGLLVVPMSVLLTPREVAHVIRDSQLAALIVPASLSGVARQAAAEAQRHVRIVTALGAEDGEVAFAELEEAEPLQEVACPEASRHMMTLYTSGTTGAPKGAMISCENLMSQVEMMSDAFPIGHNERLLCVLPLFHAFALNALLLCAVRHGATVVLHPRFELEACVRSLREDGITWFAGVPTIYQYLLQAMNDGGALPTLRCCVSGGAALPDAVAEAFLARFGLQIYEGYGLTETTVGVTANRAGCHRKGSVGKPYAGVSVAVLGEDGAPLPAEECGEIAVRGPNVMLGYLGRADDTARVIRDGWFITGDLGRLDADGFLRITGRKQDLIIKGGYNIYPKEIEDVLANCPGVAEAAVVGVHDPLKGERVRAVITLRPGHAPTEELLRRHLNGVLAKYKHPNEFVIVEELPRGPSGKVVKQRLREMSA